jgi:hypothetical protein
MLDDASTMPLPSDTNHSVQGKVFLQPRAISLMSARKHMQSKLDKVTVLGGQISAIVFTIMKI